jgi:hypothetical protein
MRFDIGQLDRLWSCRAIVRSALSYIIDRLSIADRGRSAYPTKGGPAGGSSAAGVGRCGSRSCMSRLGEVEFRPTVAVAVVDMIESPFGRVERCHYLASG